VGACVCVTSCTFIVQPQAESRKYRLQHLLSDLSIFPVQFQETDVSSHTGTNFSQPYCVVRECELAGFFMNTYATVNDTDFINCAMFVVPLYIQLHIHNKSYFSCTYTR